MKKFSNQLAFLFLPVCFYVFIYEYIYRTIPNTYSYKFNYLSNKEKSSKIKVLVLGTSHVYKGFNPNVLKHKTFIGACDLQPIYYDYQLLHHFLTEKNNLTNLKYVVLAYDYISLVADQKITPLRESNYSIYWHFPSINNLPWYKQLKCLNPNTNVLRSLITNFSLVQCDSLGWNYQIKDTIQKSEVVKNAINAVKRHSLENIESNTLVQKNKNRIIEMAKECKNKNIKLILLNVPKTKAYISRLHLKQKHLTTKFADYLQEQYDNILYLNWENNSNFDLNDFNDSDHLNIIGASKLGVKMDSLFFILDKNKETTHFIKNK